MYLQQPEKNALTLIDDLAAQGRSTGGRQQAGALAQKVQRDRHRERARHSRVEQRQSEAQRMGHIEVNQPSAADEPTLMAEQSKRLVELGSGAWRGEHRRDRASPQRARLVDANVSEGRER